MPGRNGFEAALQTAMTGTPFSTLFPPSMYMSPLPQHIIDHPPIASNMGNLSENQMIVPSSSKSQPNDSPGRHNGESSSQGNSRNNCEPPQGNSRNNGEPPRDPEPARNAMPANNQHPSGTNWSYEDQFKQVRQASTWLHTYVSLGFSRVWTRAIAAS